MQPLKLNPAIKNYLWGGNRLSREYGLPAVGDVQAEGWMLSCHKDGESVVASGDFAGQTLSEVLEANPGFAGTRAEGKAFPLLIKLIDAKDRLSVQVHPDDAYAMRVEGEYGKNEAWYIVDCDDGAELIYGFRESISREEFRSAIENGTLLDKVNRVKVKKGDFFFISAGTLHAIGKGILLAEIQQSSNSTYRVYDYGRMQNGKPRELHIDKAVDVTECCPPAGTGKPSGERSCVPGGWSTELVSCPLFRSSLLEITDNYTGVASEESFVSLLVLDGEGSLTSQNKELPVKKGDSLFLPAGGGDFVLSGSLSVLSTRL